jgi:hypothetical protein
MTMPRKSHNAGREMVVRDVLTGASCVITADLDPIMEQVEASISRLPQEKADELGRLMDRMSIAELLEYLGIDSQQLIDSVEVRTE